MLALLVSSVVAIHLFRLSGNIWPMYFLASMGVLHAFAIAFSRGRALGPSSTFISVIVSCWVLWELPDWPRFSQFRVAGILVDLREWFSDNPVPVVVFLLVASTVWMFMLGNATALDGLHETARLYLSIGAFILGIWGAWGFLVQIGIVPEWFIHASILVTVVSPLVIILAESDSVTSLDSKLLSITFLVSLATGYLMVARMLVNMVSYFISELLPRLVGGPPVPEFDDFWVLRISNWMGQILFVLTSVALLSLVAASIVKTVHGFQVWVPKENARRKKQKANQRTNGFASVLEALVEWVLTLAYLAVNFSLMILGFVTSLVENVFIMLREIPNFAKQIILRLVIPVATFAAISLAFLIVLQNLQVYIQGLSSDSASQALISASALAVDSGAGALWGEIITVALFAMVAGSTTFLFASFKFRNEGLAAICVVVLGYLAVTAVATTLALMLAFLSKSVSLPPQLVEYGDILRLNFTCVAILAVLMLIPTLPTVLGQIRGSSASAHIGTVSMFLISVPVFLFSAYAVVLGIRPLVRQSWSVVFG